MITLSEALKSGRLAEFITQEEGRGVGRADQSELDAAIKLMATDTQPEDRTLRSHGRDGSNGK